MSIADKIEGTTQPSVNADPIEGTHAPPSFNGGATKSKNKNTKATVKDIVRVAFINQYAGALRYLGRSIHNKDTQKIIEDRNTKDDWKVPDYLKLYNDDELVGDDKDFLTSGNTAIPLVGDDRRGLTQAMSRNAVPMSNRSMDCNISFLFDEMDRRDFKRKEGSTIDLPHNKDLHFDQKHFETLYETMFSCTLFRVLGRTQPFKLWGRQKKDGSHNYIPKPNQLEEFLDFFKQTIAGSKSRSMNPWISSQHCRSTPEEWQRWMSFVQFARGLQDRLSVALTGFFKANQGGFDDHWPKAVSMLQSVLTQLCHKSKNDLRWLAQQIIGDMDALFTTVFGECKTSDIVSGYGSKSCLIYLQNGNLFNKKHSNNLADSLEAIIEHVNDPKEVPDECLAVGGYYRREDGKVCDLMNGTLFDGKHAEHWMCKMYLHIKYTGSHYRKVYKPRAFATHCWPQKFRQADCDDITKSQRQLKKLMQTTVERFRRIMTGSDKTLQQMLEVPEIILLPNESIKAF